MRHRVHIVEPSPEMMLKIRRAREAIVNQKSRMIQCPYCRHNALAVFEDTRGHVQTKCKQCGSIVTIDVVNMRRKRQTDEIPGTTLGAFI